MQALYDLLGLPVDQVKFLICQILSLLLGIVFRVYFKPNQTNSLQRHVVSTSAGLLLGFYCFDQEFLHILICSYVVYFFMVVLPRRYAHLVVLAFVMSYLSCVHIFYQYYYYGVKRFDISSPMMIIVQKLTYVAFSYYDGTRPVDSLTKFQKAHVLKELPSFIEFSSYILNFQGVIIGPSCVYQDYIDFITGLNVLKHNKKSSTTNSVDYDQLKVNQVVVYKLLKVGLLMFIFLNVTVHLPMSSNMDPLILSKPLWYRFLYFFSSADAQRIYYYIAWTLSDAVHNISGFGYNGFDEQTGEAKWDLLNNVNIYSLETSTNIKSIIDNWHIQTSKWLRVIAFERMPRGKTLGVFVLSAFWHGFYPGYYITFIMGAVLVYLGRGIRRTVRPYFLRNKVLFFFYDIVCWVVTQFTISFITAPFFFLSLKGSVQFFNSWYWCVQIAAIVLFIALPKNSLESKPRTDKKETATTTTTTTPENNKNQ